MKKEIIRRIKSPAPPFFKRMQEVGAALVASAITLYGMPIECPEGLTGYLLVAGVVITGISQMTVTEPPPIE